MEISTDRATSLFSEGFACSQAVFTTAFAPEFNLSKEMALKIASSFGGGMARSGMTCGAVTGGLMALGLKYGFTSPDGKDATYGIAREFMRRFEERYGSLACRELIGFDISAPESRERAQQAGVFTNVCPLLVRETTEIVQEMLAKGL